MVHITFLALIQDMHTTTSNPLTLVNFCICCCYGSLGPTMLNTPVQVCMRAGVSLSLSVLTEGVHVLDNVPPSQLLLAETPCSGLFASCVCSSHCIVLLSPC